jgi:hypothetical protein
MNYEKPTAEELLEFLKKNKLSKTDIRDIFSLEKNNTSFYAWFNNNKNGKAGIPNDKWFVLNALFNREAPFIAEILDEYGKGEAYRQLIKESAFLERQKKEAELKKKIIEDLKETEKAWSEYMSIERKEESLARLHQEHFKKIDDLYLAKLGLKAGAKNRDIYLRLINIEEDFSIECGIILDELQNLDEEFLSGKENDFIKKLNEINKEYFERLNEVLFIEYVKNLGDENMITKITNEMILANFYNRDMPASQKKEIEKIEKEFKSTDLYLDKSARKNRKKHQNDLLEKDEFKEHNNETSKNYVYQKPPEKEINLETNLEIQDEDNDDEVVMRTPEIREQMKKRKP